MAEFFKTTAQILGCASFAYLVVSYWYLYKFKYSNVKINLIVLCLLFIATPVLFIISNFFKYLVGA